ncbi:ABC transporter ATP-binding protein [Alienimonas californiensis]|uniref:Teichoic acids export ATP-binding protein TagH n=1 Tax=Alienimonas californiensis TaxID=2527989 RepID=A0A517P478_9PLAN|nr:ABC transporter ATP-binding protein [Alienimonas californiensis]QDT14187.1 Teichoic acids export ATP-binding protein TagH [Alienimonas californiensis]
MSRPAITVDCLSKAYRIGLAEDTSGSAAAKAWRLAAAPMRNLRNLARLNTHDAEDAPDLFWALKDVSFEVAEGEVVGVIGQNGAGKSTLLKVLSRIARPTRGSATIRGRVSSLLEVGTGFHPELTGRDNVYMNGTVLGMSKAEIDRKFDEIVEFSGVEKFLDTPVKRYSSGMKVRLAFAVAAHLEPEILIIDEVLAVGDAEFQARCLGKMEDVAGQGRTVLFVSHNMGAVRQLCSRGVVLQSGEKIADCEVGGALAAYSQGVERTSGLRIESGRPGDGGVRLREVLVFNESGNSDGLVMAGELMTLRLRIEIKEPLPSLGVTMTMYNSVGAAITNFSTALAGQHWVGPAEGEWHAACEIPSAPFLPGRYRLAVDLQCNGRNLDWVGHAASIEVAGSKFFPGGRTPDPEYCAMMVEHRWQFLEA